MHECPLDVAAIVRLAARGDAELDGFDPFYLLDEDGIVRRLTFREHLQHKSAELALVAASRLAALVGATGLVPEVRRWADTSPIADEPIPIRDVLTDALILAVGDGLPPELLEPLLAEPDDRMVCRIVGALDPERQTDLMLLHRLAEDPRTEVAAAARRRLGPRHRWRWYSGIFEHDPISAHEGDPVLVEALERARAALGKEHPEAAPSRVAALVSAVDDLPSALAIPLLEAGLLAFLPPESKRAASKVEPGGGPVVGLYARAGIDAVVRALCRLARAHGEPRWALPRAAPWCSALPDPARAELVLRMLPWVERGAPSRSTEAAPDEPPSEPLPDPTGAAHLAAAVWPRALVPLPLIEWFVIRPYWGIPGLVIKDAIDQSTAELEPHAERLFELAMAHPRLVHELRALYGRLASAVPRPRLAAMAEAALSSSHEKLHAWALEQRTDRLAPSDPAQRHAMVEAWLHDPRTRKAIFASDACRVRLLPWLRRRLRAGASSLGEATRTMSTIGRLHGGVFEPRSWEHRHHGDGELGAAERRAKARAERGQWLDPPQGPPTPQEWACVRALARALLDAREQPAWDVLTVLPIGPWTEQDLALLDAMERSILRLDEMAAVMMHHYSDVLKRVPPPDTPIRARRVLAAWASADVDPEYRLELATLRRLAEGDPAADDHAPAPVDPDWMDEDDDEELEP